jgi:hypothetical protein
MFLSKFDMLPLFLFAVIIICTFYCAIGLVFQCRIKVMFFFPMLVTLCLDIDCPCRRRSWVGVMTSCVDRICEAEGITLP